MTYMPTNDFSGDTVFVRDFPNGKKWLPGTVTQSKGPLSFVIELDDSHVIRCHIDHIRVRPPSTAVPISTRPSHDDWPDDTILYNSAPSNSGLRRSSHTRKPPDRFH